MTGSLALTTPIPKEPNDVAIVISPLVVLQSDRSFPELGHGAIGSTADFGSVNPGSSPGAPA